MRGSSLIRIVQVGIQSLRLHKLRSGLTMLGMIIGVWAVIVLVAIGEGASHDAQEAIKALGAQNVIIRSVKPMSDKVQLQGSDMEWETIYGLKNSDASRISKTYLRDQSVACAYPTQKHYSRQTRCRLPVDWHLSVLPTIHPEQNGGGHFPQ